MAAVAHRAARDWPGSLSSTTVARTCWRSGLTLILNICSCEVRLGVRTCWPVGAPVQDRKLSSTRKPIIDSGTRLVVEEAPALPLVPERDRGLPPAPFVELGVRTAFTGLSVVGAVEGPTVAHAARAWPGASVPEEVADRACLLGYDAFAVTDVDTVAGVVRAHSRAKELGLRLIVGAELWLEEGSLLLHAADRDGYTHLCRLLTLARDGLEKGEIDHQLDRVCAHAEGLFATLLPPFSRELGPLKDAFGERLSIGVFRHGLPEDGPRLQWAKELGRRYGAPLLATGRALLTDRADKRLHDVITCIRQGLTLEEAGQRLMPNAEAVMRSPEGMKALFKDLPEAVARSREIADAVTFELGHLRYAFPAEQREGGESPQQTLERLTLEGAQRRYGAGQPEDLPVDVARQLDHELELIATLDVAPYFLTVWEIVEIARELGILCQGRGSAANSAVCYCLGITSIDPVRMGLLFERFLSVERGEPPDIDVDFEHERREEVIQAIYARWGRRHAAMVCNVIAFRGRSAIREVGKVYGLSETVCGKLVGLMWSSSISEVTDARLSSMGITSTAHLVERTLHYARRMTGQPRHLGIHVGGFVLTQDPIDTLAPVEPARMEGRTVLPFDKDDVEALGLFKMDVLALGMLTCIRKGLDLVEEHEGERYFLHTLPPEDEKVYDAICKADTIGVFQIESRAQMAMLPRLRPRTFYDLVIEVAIIRPGPIQGGMVHPYLRRRQGDEPVEYPHDSLRPILERTLGVPLFQEQVMRIAVEGAGYSPGEADQLRRDMAAWKKHGKLGRHKPKLLAGFAERGISQEFGERLFEQIRGFGEYGFPESHAASFAILVYASSWLKTYHPAIFACALLNSQPMGFYSPSQICTDAQEHGVRVLPVSVNHSDWDCTLERNDPSAPQGGPLELRLGMRLVKGLSGDEADRILDERDEGGPFKDPHDVFRRADLSKKAQQALARAGALDGISRHRRAALWTAMEKQLPLLAHLPSDDVTGVIAAPTAQDVLEMDFGHAQVSVGDHPMCHLRPIIKRALAERPGKPKLVTARGVQETAHHTHVVTAGLVTGRQRPGTADGTCFVTLEDETGMTNVIVWGRNFDAWRQTVVTSTFLLVEGVVEREGIVVHLVAKRVETVRPGPDPFPYRSRDFR